MSVSVTASAAVADSSPEDATARLYPIPMYARATPVYGRSAVRPGAALYRAEIAHAVTDDVWWGSVGLYRDAERALAAAREHAIAMTHLPPEYARLYDGYCAACGVDLSPGEGQGPEQFCSAPTCEAERASRDSRDSRDRDI